MMVKNIILSMGICLLAACTKSLTYEQRVDAYNAIAQSKYNACYATLEPTENDSFMSMHADGICSYSQQTTGADGESCSAQYRRKKTAFIRGKRTCEPYHAVEDADGRLMIETRFNGETVEIKTVTARSLSEEDKWTADFACRDNHAASTLKNIIMQPYIIKPVRKSKFRKTYPTIGWKAITHNGKEIDLGNLRTNPIVQRCSIEWRYPKIQPSQHEMTIERATNNSKNAAQANR